MPAGKALDQQFEPPRSEKNSAKTINANTTFGSKAIAPLIIPWTLFHTGPIDVSGFITPLFNFETEVDITRS